jgi:hypothetical protein
VPEGIPLKLAYLLRDPNSGTIVVPDLYHLGGQWTVRALLPGYPGSTTLGDFTIQLPPVYGEEFGRYKAQYDAILNATNRGVGLKVEGYLNDVGAGAPVVSGVLAKMSLPLDGPWELTGSDTLYWLQQSQLFAGEEGSLLAGTYRAHQIAEAMYGTRELLYDDDFTNWNSGANYSSSGFGDSFNDIVYGQKAISANADGSYAITNGTWTDDQFGAGYQLLQAASVTAWGVAVGDDTAGSGTGPAPGLWLLADSTGANGILVDFLMKETGAASAAYNIDARINTRVAGTFTQRALVSNVYTNVPGIFPFELTAVLYTNTQPGFAPKVGVRVLLNGKDTGAVFYDGIDWTVPATGRLGVRHGSSGGTTATYFNRLRFQSRTAGWWGTSRFAVGSSYNGNFVPAPFGGQGQTHLDIIQAAAAFDGASVRKDPGAGTKGDKLNYGLSLGTDYSSSIVLAEGGNVMASGSTLSNVAEVYATEAHVNGVPFGDSGGSMTWPSSVGASGDMVLTDTVSDVGMVGFSFLTRYGRAIAARKGAPIVATQLQVVRTADMLRANNGWGPRELDSVQIHLPTYGIRHQAAQIVGYTVTEGSAVATYYLTQFPEAVLPQAALQRLWRSVDYLSTTYTRR